jgi:predicted lipoprotein with Yx(FWY)xxD motif
MKRPVATIAALAVAIALVVGLSTALAAKHTTERGTTVSVARSTLGSILADRSGRTLYLFTRDKGGHSTCYGSCAKTWPPLIVSGKPSAGGGAKASLLGTTRRRDGPLQATAGRRPERRRADERWQWLLGRGS